jgi:hypothetical protein
MEASELGFPTPPPNYHWLRSVLPWGDTQFQAFPAVFNEAVPVSQGQASKEVTGLQLGCVYVWFSCLPGNHRPLVQTPVPPRGPLG